MGYLNVARALRSETQSEQASRFNRFRFRFKPEPTRDTGVRSVDEPKTGGCARTVHSESGRRAPLAAALQGTADYGCEAVESGAAGGGVGFGVKGDGLTPAAGVVKGGASCAASESLYFDSCRGRSERVGS